MAGFDYPYTCPQIDRAITEAHSEINRFIDELIEQLSPVLYENMLHSTRTSLSELYGDDLYRRLEKAFEAVRSSNQNIRSAAEAQIEQLEATVSELNSELQHVRQQLDATEQQVSDLQRALDSATELD